MNSSTHNPLSCSLDGVTLIEASAGTGKTWTISALYLRLVLEKALPVEHILVVTYTKAATAELKDRIRKRLLEARQGFTDGAAQDPFLRQLVDAIENKDNAVLLLNRAIASFDLSSIFTIHSFCQRVLSRFAFDTRLPLEMEVLPDIGDILNTIIKDYWRFTIAEEPPLVVHYLVNQRGLEPATLEKLVYAFVGRPYLVINAPAEIEITQERLNQWATVYRDARVQWVAHNEDISDLLLNHPSLNRNKYRKTSVSDWLNQLVVFFADEDKTSCEVIDKFEKLTTTCLKEAVKKGAEFPGHAFFDACDALYTVYSDLSNALEKNLGAYIKRCIEYTNTELESRKAQLRVQSYDDLLIQLYRALENEDGASLAGTIRNTYQAALIDEFQDTDPIQYQIFTHIYGGHDAPVFFVGDPKQAIYSFRGADVFAYLDAARDATQRATLNENWRSIPAYIDAVNALFAGETPFYIDEIPFKPVKAAEKEREPLLLPDDDGKALRFWLIDGEGEGEVSKEVAAKQAAQSTAAEIARLLTAGAQGRASIGATPLDGGHIAVLVPTHHHGQRVKQELDELEIPCVRYGQDNVYLTDEAVELERVLVAVAEPGREVLIKAALATRLLGWQGNDIARMWESEASWETKLDDFRSYYELWRQHGFIQMIWELMIKEGVAARVLALPQGERRLTNVYHLIEILHIRSRERYTGMEGLIQWFTEQCRSETAQDEQRLLRLESDERVVKIVTIHTSKGLEYPIVFCPFLWDGAVRSKNKHYVIYHDPDENNAAVLDLGADPEKANQLASGEEFAEKLRLTYVALTRAKHRCYVIHGNIKTAVASPLTWLLCKGQGDGNAGWNETKAAIERLAVALPAAISIEPIPGSGEPFNSQTSDQTLGAAKIFTRKLGITWRVTSYSGLARSSDSETPDYDAMRFSSADASNTAETNLFSFPRGAKAGTCLHSLFEHWDFTNTDANQMRLLVENTLADHGIPEYERWAPIIEGMLSDVLDTPLDDQADIVLRAVTNKHRVNELQFYFPLHDVNATGFRNVLAKHDFLDAAGLPDRLSRLRFETVRGFLKGFIDLVFESDGRYYIVDYKSNWLGSDYEAYQGEHLAAAMSEHHYDLQFLIYTVAIHRFLGTRLVNYDYDTHFGGVFYLFLRGMRPAYGNRRGVYAYRPSYELVAALDAYFGQGNGYARS